MVVMARMTHYSRTSDFLLKIFWIVFRRIIPCLSTNNFQLVGVSDCTHAEVPVPLTISIPSIFPNFNNLKPESDKTNWVVYPIDLVS